MTLEEILPYALPVILLCFYLLYKFYWNKDILAKKEEPGFVPEVAKEAFSFVFAIFLVVKSTLKLLGYGTPINTFYVVIYSGGLIIGVIFLSTFVYTQFIKKKSN